MGYLFIGIIVAIVGAIGTLVDLRKQGLTIYDLCPELKAETRGFTICVLSVFFIIMAIVWPWNVYHWIKDAVART